MMIVMMILAKICFKILPMSAYACIFFQEFLLVGLVVGQSDVATGVNSVDFRWYLECIRIMWFLLIR